jgi:hypothetical protein
MYSMGHEGTLQDNRGAVPVRGDGAGEAGTVVTSRKASNKGCVGAVLHAVLKHTYTL